MRKLWPSLLALALVTVFGIVRRNDLPVEVATHWNLRGEADGWGSRTFAVYFMPMMGVVLAVVLSVVPRIDPKRANFEQHAAAFWLLVNAVLLFFAAMHLFLIGVNLGWPVSIAQVVGIGVGGLMLVLGNYFARIRQNWFLGIRTPWTLSSERSWRETHRLGGKLFVAGGILLIAATLIAGTMPLWALLAGVAAPSLFLLGYSYFIWSNDPAAQENKR